MLRTSRGRGRSGGQMEIKRKHTALEPWGDIYSRSKTQGQSHSGTVKCGIRRPTCTLRARAKLKTRYQSESRGPGFHVDRDTFQSVWQQWDRDALVADGGFGSSDIFIFMRTNNTWAQKRSSAKRAGKSGRPRRACSCSLAALWPQTSFQTPLYLRSCSSTLREGNSSYRRRPELWKDSYSRCLT